MELFNGRPENTEGRLEREILIYEVVKMLARVNRIKKYEAIFDRVQSGKGNSKDLQQLEAYYTSQKWKDDFEADEKGLLPKDLKRGVLSEDGIYNLLSN